MNNPVNQFKEQVAVGDTVVLTTTSGKWARTRVARVVKFVQGSEIRKWDPTLRVNVPTGAYNTRVFVRLYKRSPVRDPLTGKWNTGLYVLKPYVKEVFGISESVKIDPSTLPVEIQEVLNGK